MALRRLAQTNHAVASASPLSSPKSPGILSSPSTPKNRPKSAVASPFRSPSATPSISSSSPFDWDAARSMKPPPYGTPFQKKLLKARKGGVPGTPKQRMFKRRGFIERIIDIPLQLVLDFPENVPLPAPKTSAFLLGGVLHFLHLCVRVSQIRRVPDSDLGWEDMYREGDPWFDWTAPMTLLLLTASLANTFYLLTRTKLYRLHQRPDPVPSLNAAFVQTELNFEPSPISTRLWHIFLLCCYWLLNFDSPKPLRAESESRGSMQRVQQLEVWTPGELEMVLFCVYSPAHAFLWMATGSSNLIIMILVMVLAGVQLRVMSRSYAAMIKDKEIIAAEVMHEYNSNFVYPRVNPIRKDVAVMTNQAEIVDIWAGTRYY